MQYIVGALIIGIVIGICLMYLALCQYFKRIKTNYSKTIITLQDELNYYRRNENIK
ncbi:MAG: hypothetical protein GX947_03075 [Tissierellia bacterium]|nr:hypothetical protein [Tissierellia bacterium]